MRPNSPGRARPWRRAASGDVGDRDRPGAALLQLRDRRRLLGLVAADHGDRCARLRKPSGHAESDAAIAAGDDRDLAGEIE